MKWITFLILVFISTTVFAQADLDSLIIEGDKKNQEGNYKEAKKIYRQALSLCINMQQMESLTIKLKDVDYKEAKKMNDSLTRLLTVISNQKIQLRLKDDDLKKARLKLDSLHKLQVILTDSFSMALLRKNAIIDSQKTLIRRNDNILSMRPFYKNKYTIAYKDSTFYFIDKDNQLIEKLGKWKSIKLFDNRGFAQVEDEHQKKFLLDTLGNKFLISYNLLETEVIDLSNQNLSRIPEIVFDNNKVKILFLDNNNIQRIPSEIERLTNLYLFSFEKNRIARLPNEIGELKKLQILNGAYNKLDSLKNKKGLPETIKNLSELRYFNIEGNGLVSLPVEIFQLKKLEILNLKGNEINSLNEKVKELENLQELNLQKTHLSHIPKGILNLKKLQILNIKDNPFHINTIEIELNRLKHNLPHCQVIY